MSNLEICDALYADLPKLQKAAEILMPKMIRAFKKENKFPAWKSMEYTHQESKNHFLIMFYIPSPAFTEKPYYDFLAFIQNGKHRMVIKWGCWPFLLYGTTTAIATRNISYYSKHFFDRYRERVWKGTPITYNELLCRYFSRNDKTTPIEMNEKIQMKYKQYGEFANYAFKVSDGICFIRQGTDGDEKTVLTKDSNYISVVLYLTFVDNNTLKESQKIAIRKEEISYFLDFFNVLVYNGLKEQKKT